MQPKPIALIILDGWGHREESAHNPIQNAPTPAIDTLLTEYPHTLLQASGKAVGLPEGQMGNSEVGHLHIGGGRKVPQDLTRINNEIKSGEFAQNPVLLEAIKKAKKKKAAIHILGLISPGGVHSHEDQIKALIELISQHGIKNNYLHAFLDGRDTPPRSAKTSLEQITQLYTQLIGGQVASITGRYYAMDRDKRWERIAKAYALLTEGASDFHANTAVDALEMAYTRDENDEFVSPTTICADNDKPITINKGDIVIFMNFRADRARQLTQALTDKKFNSFKRHVFPKIREFITLTQYAKEIKAEVAYPPLHLINTLGEYIASQGLTQLRIAETEKYAHVTYFLNGGNEVPFENEDRTLIPSPKVATYDLQPEMSATELTDKLTAAIESQQYDVIICNYANPDMVGHTGKEEAANEAVHVIDGCMMRVLESLNIAGGEMLLTSDHGNVETMYDEQTGQPHTAHTNNLVPLLYVGRQAHFIGQGALDDVAPTMCYLLNLPQPEEMTGHNLLKFD